MRGDGAPAPWAQHALTCRVPTVAQQRQGEEAKLEREREALRAFERQENSFEASATTVAAAAAPKADRPLTVDDGRWARTH
jgi:hypothetical protein